MTSSSEWTAQLRELNNSVTSSKERLFPSMLSCNEAVFLSDRIIILKGRPPDELTEIKGVEVIDFNHPRIRKNQNFIERVECIIEKLR